MSIDEAQEKAARTIREDLSDGDTILHALFGLASEVGELHSIHQKRFQGHDYSREHEIEELGDILWFWFEYLTARGMKASDVVKANEDKLGKRYKEHFTAEESIARIDHERGAEDEPETDADAD